MTENDLRIIMQKVFPNALIPEDIKSLKLGDIDGWDSLGNLNLLLAIESEQKIRFSMDQISEIKSVTQILDVLN